ADRWTPTPPFPPGSGCRSGRGHAAHPTSAHSPSTSARYPDRLALPSGPRWQLHELDDVLVARVRVRILERSDSGTRPPSTVDAPRSRGRGRDLVGMAALRPAAARNTSTLLANGPARRARMSALANSVQAIR